MQKWRRSQTRRSSRLFNWLNEVPWMADRFVLRSIGGGEFSSVPVRFGFGVACARDVPLVNV